MLWYRSVAEYCPRRELTKKTNESNYCDAERTSAGVQLENQPQQGQIMPSISKICPLHVQKVKILPNSSPNPPRTLPKSIPVGSWSPSWTNVAKYIDFKRQKNRQKGPKSVQETPQTVPSPSQMEPQTLPNRILKRFFTTYFPIRNLHGFFIVLK